MNSHERIQAFLNGEPIDKLPLMPVVILFCVLSLAASIHADEPCRAPLDVVTPQVPDRLCRVTLDQQELGGEIDRRIQNLVSQNYMVIDLDGKWLNHFCSRTDREGQSHVYYGIGKVFDAGSLFAAYTGDPKVAARTQYIIDRLVKSRDADGYLGFWNVEPENRQDHINWILHEQEYINLAFVRNYRCTGDPQSLAHAKIMGDYILQTFPTPQNPCYDAGQICTAGLPEGMLEVYRVTGDQRYFDFAADVPHGNNRGEVQLASLRTWEQDFSHLPCHVYVMLARCYAQTELYRLSGEEHLLNMSQFMRNELVMTAAQRNDFLYTHPVADTARYNVFRWTPAADMQDKDVTLCGSLFSNLGNGVEVRVIRWNDDTQYDLLGTFNTQDLTAGKCGSVEFVLRLPPGEVGKQLDFVLHNAGSHLSDATALKVRAYTNVQQAVPQTDVTDKVQARFHNRLVTPLGPYAGLFGGVAAGVEPTLKVKLHYWRDGTIRYLEFPQDSALDLTGK